MELRTVGAYARELKPLLPAETFEPARSRLLWLPVHAALIATLAWLMATHRVPMFVWPLFSLVIGCSLGGLTFLGHETLHGGVVRGRFAIRLVGWFGFLPFTVSPQLWVAWHNRVHHNHTGKEGVDPDMYPTIGEYRTQPAARIMADYFGVGRRRLMGFASLLFGYTGQSSQMLWTARKRGFLTPKLHRRAIFESALGWAFWITVAFLVGFVPFLFVYLLPLIVANTIVMTFIMTNHNLNPLTDTNDPLVNSLSVTLPRIVEWLTLDFGYHTEHHLFPTASTRHGRAIRDVIVSKYPERYQTLPLGTAMKQLYNTARVYQDATTLYDPPSGQTWPALVPRVKPNAAPVIPPHAPSVIDEAAKKLDEAAAAASKALDDAKAAATRKLDDAKAAATRKLDDAKAAAAKTFDDAAKKLDEAAAAASKALDDANPSRV
jgi:fatty acid desaturase